jgi:hypothetical protein
MPIFIFSLPLQRNIKGLPHSRSGNAARHPMCQD